MDHDIRAARSTTMSTGKLALRLLALSLCIWIASAATGTDTTTSGTATTSATATTSSSATTTAAATTTSAAATTTTTSAATTVASTVRRKKIRISNLKWSASRRIRVHRSSTVSSKSLTGRRVVLVRSGNRSRVLAKILKRRLTQG